MDTNFLTIDDFGPLPIRHPSSPGDVCDLIREAADAGMGVYPMGGRTQSDVGLPPSKPGFAIDTTRLSEVIDYPARDMTITVQSGIRIQSLQAILASENQWLPIDIPSPDQATLGGAVALNVSGPRRYGMGTLRDYVIGISFVTDQGVEVKAGGRVVKNVAGYDLMKLHIGAVGTLGVITQLTLKVKPRPETSVVVALGCANSSLRDLLELTHRSQSRPAVVELLNADAWRVMNIEPSIPTDWILLIGFEEKATTVNWQVATLRQELATLPVHELREWRDQSAHAIWNAVSAMQIRPESRYILRASVPPSRVAEFLTDPSTGLISAEALNGIIWFHPDEAQIARLESRVMSLGGHCMLRRCPIDRKRILPVWGHRPPSWDLMRNVKQTLDPNDLFNPGRLFGTL